MPKDEDRLAELEKAAPAEARRADVIVTALLEELAPLIKGLQARVLVLEKALEEPPADENLTRRLDVLTQQIKNLKGH